MMDMVNMACGVERSLWFTGLVLNVFISKVSSKDWASAKTEAGFTRTSGFYTKGFGRAKVLGWCWGTTGFRGFTTVVRT